MDKSNGPFKSLFTALWRAIKAMALFRIDARDVIFTLGAGSLWYGIWLEVPWLSFVVVGIIMMIVGILMRPK